MTTADVRERVESLRKRAGDDEVAHIEEDNLRDDVLTAIANGECDDAAGCAREALKTSEIEFARWYA